MTLLSGKPRSEAARSDRTLVRAAYVDSFAQLIDAAEDFNLIPHFVDVQIVLRRNDADEHAVEIEYQVELVDELVSMNGGYSVSRLLCTLYRQSRTCS